MKIADNTLKCLSIRTPKTINFPFVPNGKLMVLGVPIFEHIISSLQYAQLLGYLKIINFTFRTNGNFIILGVPILRHFTVYYTVNMLVFNSGKNVRMANNANPDQTAPSGVAPNGAV